MNDNENVEILPFPSVMAGLVTQGFKPGFPKHIRMETRRIDTDVCAESFCPVCNSRGLEFHPFHKGSVYTAVARCGSCGLEEAF